ncbi:MAG: Smr/MutS family protein [Bacteroidia bacterium]|nr:Smr/MutS family protein [Bacteroidia bacterium]
MRHARLLHVPERVEVLSIDRQNQRARIRRQGFIQELPLAELVFEEELSNAPPAPQALSGETELYLSPDLSQQRAEIRLIHGLPHSCFYTLFIQGKNHTWHPLLARNLQPSESFFLSLSLVDFMPPWLLRLQRIVASSLPLPVLPPPVDQTYIVRMVDFTKAGIQKLLPAPSSETAKLFSQTHPESKEKPTPFLPDLREEIDLHIEKLAPHLTQAGAEAIFDYQVNAMKRYLVSCEAARFSAVIVIHGIGKKKLQAALIEFCKASGWRTEKLLSPPHLGGATRVYFSS